MRSTAAKPGFGQGVHSWQTARSARRCSRADDVSLPAAIPGKGSSACTTTNAGLQRNGAENVLTLRREESPRLNTCRGPCGWEEEETELEKGG